MLSAAEAFEPPMHPAFSVIFFTTISGCGYGLLFLLGLSLAANPLLFVRGSSPGKALGAGAKRRSRRGIHRDSIRSIQRRIGEAVDKSTFSSGAAAAFDAHPSRRGRGGRYLLTGL